MTTYDAEIVGTQNHQIKLSVSQLVELRTVLQYDKSQRPDFYSYYEDGLMLSDILNQVELAIANRK
jgi:hypothetical protein